MALRVFTEKVGLPPAVADAPPPHMQRTAGAGGGGLLGSGRGGRREMYCNAHWQERFARNAVLEFTR